LLKGQVPGRQSGHDSVFQPHGRLPSPFDVLPIRPVPSLIFPLRAAAADVDVDVDVVIDYLWGVPAAAAMMALLAARADRSRALDWIQIGAMAGPTIELLSVALRSANLRLQGNGQGAVSTSACLAELPSLIDQIDAGTIKISARPVPLADVEATWTAPDVPGVRTVFVPEA
jgi:hypothetical protein